MRSNISILLLLALVALTSCGTPEKIKTEAHELTALANGPMFSGVNTATAEFEISDILPQGIKPDQIASAGIKAINVHVKSKNAPTILAYTALLSSPKEAMKQFAFSTDSSSATVQLSIAKEQDFIDPMLRDESQTLVLDFDLEEDWFDHLELGVVIDWEISINR